MNNPTRTQHQPREMNDESRLREAELRRNYVPWSHATLWRRVKAGEFPAPEKLSPNVTAWRWGDVKAWLDERRAGERGAA